MATYENFISYRRSESALVARNIYDALRKAGLSTFCDVYELGAGRFDEKLLSIIGTCTNFILILGKESLKRCVEADDWLTKEIQRALETRKNIIPILTDNLEDILIPENLSFAIEEILRSNALPFELVYFDAFVERLKKKFIVSEWQMLESDASRDFIIEDSSLLKYIGDAPKVIIPDNVKVIGENAFKNQTRVQNVIFNEGLEKIGDGAFERCIDISSISLPCTVRHLGKRAFSRCYKLTFVQLNEELVTIEDECFSACTSLKSFLINSGLTSLSSTAFNNCVGLSRIDVSPDNKYYTSERGVLYSFDKETIFRCPENFQEEVNLHGVKVLAPYCFFKCSKILSLSLGKDVTTIGESAFQDCANISDLFLPDSINYLAISAFEGWIPDRQKISTGEGFNPIIRAQINAKLQDLAKVENSDLGYKFCLIKSAFESEDEARNMAKMLLDNRLIVSAQIAPIKSIYLWEQKLSDEKEIELTCFTESGLYKEVEKFICQHHSYEVCELICLPIINISPEFGDWISEYTGNIKFKNL